MDTSEKASATSAHVETAAAGGYAEMMRTVVITDSQPPATTAALSGRSQTTTKTSKSIVWGWHLGMAVLLTASLLGGGAWVIKWLLMTKQFAVTKVRIEGDIQHIDPAKLRQTITVEITNNFFALDLNKIRRAVKSLPWVAEAQVRRVWPLTLVVSVRERKVLAHWGEHSLVSPEGVVFTPDPQTIPTGLDYLQGSDDSASQVIEHYHWIKERLATKGMKMARLILSDRHAWYLDLSTGLRLSLGTKYTRERLERFLYYLPRLPQAEALEQVDLRYINGFAARWRVPVVTAP